MKIIYTLLLPLSLLCNSGVAQHSDPALAVNNPQLKLEGIYRLTLPFIDSATTPGTYQDATIEYAPQQNSWRLVSYKRGGLARIFPTQTVEVVMTGEAPIQVFLKTSGYYIDCGGEDGRTSQRLIGNTFEVSLFDGYYDPENRTYLCPGQVFPYTKVIPLPVYGLKAGQYRYVLNGQREGTFTIAADNVLE